MKTYHNKIGTRREALSHYLAPRFTLFPVTVTLPEFVSLFKNFVTCSAISLGRCPLTSLLPGVKLVGVFEWFHIQESDREALQMAEKLHE